MIRWAQKYDRFGDVINTEEEEPPPLTYDDGTPDYGYGPEESKPEREPERREPGYWPPSTDDGEDMWGQ